MMIIHRRIAATEMMTDPHTCMVYLKRRNVCIRKSSSSSSHYSHCAQKPNQARPLFICWQWQETFMYAFKAIALELGIFAGEQRSDAITKTIIHTATIYSFYTGI